MLCLFSERALSSVRCHCGKELMVCLSLWLVLLPSDCPLPLLQRWQLPLLFLSLNKNQQTLTELL